MSDLAPGTIVLGGDTPPTVYDAQPDGFTFNATTFGTDNDSGTYNDCAVVFLASTTGRALITWAGSVENSGANATQITPVAREGGTIGAGTEVLAASVDNQLSFDQTTSHQCAGPPVLLEGLTPGADYNVRLEHRVTGGTGTIRRRHLIVAPAT